MFEIHLNHILFYLFNITQLESCLPRPELLSGYPSLLDGTLIHAVWLQIDPEPQYNPIKLINLDENTLGNARSKNFDYIVKNLKTIYEEELGQTILLLPDCSILGCSPGLFYFIIYIILYIYIILCT